MARGIPYGADRNVRFPMYNGARLRLWSHYPAELAPDLIVTPMLFGTPREALRSQPDTVCTLPPRGLVVLQGRGEAHVRSLLEEVAPRLKGFAFAFVYDADQRRLHHVDRPELWMQPSQLPAILRQVLVGYDGGPDVEVEVACEQLSRALREMPTPDEVETFRALPAIERRVAEAARRFEDNPLHLWEAMLWRGEAYRWELVNGEVPLVGELWSPLAANRTLLQCVADAERAFAQRATEDPAWIRCGPFRMRQRGSRVELRYRAPPADRRAAFMPASHVDGEDAMPSLFGALLAGGGKGKTEMIHGYVDSVIMAHERHDAGDVAEHLAGEIRRVVGAEAIVERSEDYWPSEPGEAWRVYSSERYVYVYMPAGRAEHAAWDAQSGLHLSDDFVFWRWGREKAESDADGASSAPR
ncbi:MAG: hypothetical protein R3A52_32550 [Polyangiales bacterium]